MRDTQDPIGSSKVDWNCYGRVANTGTIKYASAGNRTRVTSMATMYSTTRPLMLLVSNARRMMRPSYRSPWIITAIKIAIGIAIITITICIIIMAEMRRARTRNRAKPSRNMTLAGLEPAIFGSEDQRLIH